MLLIKLKASIFVRPEVWNGKSGLNRPGSGLEGEELNKTRELEGRRRDDVELKSRNGQGKMKGNHSRNEIMRYGLSLPENGQISSQEEEEIPANAQTSPQIGPMSAISNVEWELDPKLEVEFADGTSGKIKLVPFYPGFNEFSTYFTNEQSRGEKKTSGLCLFGTILSESTTATATSTILGPRMSLGKKIYSSTF